MKLYCLTLALSAIFLFGCFITPESIRELNQRQDALEAKMDELLEELKADNSNTDRDIERIENNQMLLAEEIESIQKKSITLGKKIDKVTNKNGDGYNKGNKAPSAKDIYYKAEASYNERKYEDAILEYQQLIDTYPKSWRVPNAYLKQGNALINLGRKKEAAFFFNTLIDKYPNSREAKIARLRLKAI
ncbi:MAG: tetratricopeptide repeat protein [Candidatus Dadabacteria bacterium]|nr:MAG: tetratricopeptide repeat protein [Candidatus Dadabacteria bacterium]